MPQIYRAGSDKKREKAKYVGSITMNEREASPETVRKLYDDSSFFVQTKFNVLSIGYKMSIEANKGRDKALVYKASVYAQWGDMKDAGMTLSVSTDRDATYAEMLLLAIMHEYKYRLDIIAEDDVEF